MKTTIFMIFAFVLFSSSTCKKDQQAPEIKSELIGKWKYTGRSGGYAGKRQKADSTVKTILQFKKDNTFLRIENDKVVQHGRYALLRIKSIYSGKEEDALQLDAASDLPGKAAIVTLKNDSLTIADNVYDGFISSYIRIQASK